MSAHMCNQKTLTAIAVWALKEAAEAIPSELMRELDQDGYERSSGGYARTVARIVAFLAAENIRSMVAAYPRDRIDRDAIMAGFTPLTRQDELRAKALPVLHVIKTCRYYAYQSCEHNGWERSPARRIVEALERQLVPELPGYDDAPWGLT